MKANEKVTAGLKQAILAEMDGRHFYLMAAEKTSDSKGKEVFLQLADEELEHHQFLKKQYQAILQNGRPDSQLKLGAQRPLGGESPIFSPALKKRLGQAQYEMSALSIGLQLEQNAMNFYRTQAEQAAEPTIRRFFQELAEWENNHYRALLAQQEALKEDYWSGSGFAPF